MHHVKTCLVFGLFRIRWLKGLQGLNPRVIRFQSLHVLLHHLVGIGKIFWCAKVAGQSNLNSKFNLNMNIFDKTVPALEQ